MKHFTLALLLLLICSCTKNPETYIPHLTGYWEIESVTLANGNIKDYKINKTIDYIFIEQGLEGFRQKMNPLFNGSYETSKVTQPLSLKLENDSLNIYYKTQYATWKETILYASKDQLKIINQNNDVYLYKRFTPITIE